MTSIATAEVRFVRCPKCGKVLVEPKHPLYTCGGCGVILKAKNRKNGRSVSSGSLEKSSQKNQLEHDAGFAKLTSSGQTENHCDIKECSSNLNTKEQAESADCSIEPSGNRNLNGVSLGESECLSDLNVIKQLEDQLEHDSEDVKSTGSVPIENYSDNKECSSDLSVKDQIESTDCFIEPSEPSESSNFLNGVSSGDSDLSSDLNVTDQVEVSSGDSECSSNLNAKEKMESTDCCIEPSENKNFLNGVSSGDSECSSDPSMKERIESTACSMKPSGSRNFLNGVSAGDSLGLDDGKEQIESGNCAIKQSGSTSFLKGVSSGDFSSHEREENSSEAGRNTQTDEHDASQSPDSELSSGGNSSSIASQRQSDESNPTKMNLAALKKQLQQSQETSHHESDNTRSVETVEASRTAENGKISEGLSGTPDGISKYPTARSCHAYDGSVSSYDERDDQVPEQPSHLPKRSWFKRQVEAEFPPNKERPRREDGLKNKIGNNPEVRHQGRKLLSISSGEKHGLKWEGSKIQAQGQLGSPDSDGLHPRKNWMRTERDGFWSRESFQRGFPSDYENGRPSNYRHEEFPRRTSSCSSSKADYFEQMELLRKLDELRDQLRRSYTQRGMANGRFPPRSTQQVKQQPLCHSYEQLDSKVPYSHDANYHRHPHAPYGPRKNRCQKCESSQVHFSGQGTNCRNHVGYSCYHCCPKDWQCRTRLPPSGTSYNNMGRSAHRCCEPYGSSSATQPKNTNSCFSQQGCRMHYQDKGFMDHDLQKKYYRDRRHPIKKYCQPIAGGAPFVICYMCSTLLQLPKDFLSQKRIYQLQCSACSQVLKFSLQNRTHIIPEVDNSSDAITGRNLVSISHANDCPQGEPVSYSDNCETSRSKSSSTEGGVLPFPILQGNEEVPEDSHSEEKVQGKNKSVFKQSGSHYKTYSEVSESTVASLEGKVAPRVSSSPLHQLLGYSSPSELINGH
ncbi:protein ENHANCED DISEASE RESISTANCE 4-like [Macadamia integrifolia]|uniref:protein ENHANCED DISEASE RESISTANCE 4-like n=1 Tax=Macadamia integrifolia TaxID=60698 RepID=UPI001C5331B0|nr:protein ENHANCED DISEASE RESISTANCE 4-like [Macadamia integrifolia]XP_042475870.1 protein ENHANCED DISEASE RESISTANCE 4-like [Macadamia integrifolia]XP_042475871.1 protein ENHANCED DISEASE RESISTANCE 4-like [Macadamia integrifolia]XP_042475874.1 protein ENHANCED DISEASE RESISTANCE 4-like [Macadamia integrifolia]